MRYEGLLEQGSVWVMVAAPSVWAAHFLLSYWVAAVWCAKMATWGTDLWPARAVVLALTVVALAVIAWLARHALRRYQGRLVIEDDLLEDTEDERTRFLGHATLLLCALSAAAVLFDALPALLAATCV